MDSESMNGASSLAGNSACAMARPKMTSFALERDTMSVPRRGGSFTNLGTISMQRRETPMMENRTVSASFGLDI